MLLSPTWGLQQQNELLFCAEAIVRMLLSPTWGLQTVQELHHPDYMNTLENYKDLLKKIGMQEEFLNTYST